jgi:hypothetical protein
VEINMALQMATVDPDWKRQAEWRERTVENINKSRQRRLEQLGKQHKAIRRAIEAYDRLDHRDLPGIGRVGPADCSAGPPSELLGRLSPQAAQASREAAQVCGAIPDRGQVPYPAPP